MSARNSALAAVAILAACSAGGSKVEDGGSRPVVPALGGRPAHDLALFVSSTCEAPAAPVNLTAVASAPNVVDLAWDDSGAPGYAVYRSDAAGGPYVRVGETTAAVVTYADATVSGGSTYFYVVRGSGCAESADSEEASVTATGDCALPPEFAGLEAATDTQQSTCSVDLAWTAATPRCGGTVTYDVYRSRTAGFTPGRANRIATGVTGTSFSDAVNLAYRTQYHYVVRAVETAARTVEERNTVARSTVPAGPVTPVIRYFDDFDTNRPPNAGAYWSATGTNLLSLVPDCRWQSPGTAYKFGALDACGGSYANSADSYLSLGGTGTVDPAVNGFAFPVGSATLTFAHWFNFENNFDGATLYYSTESASGPWTMVDDAASQTEPYISAGGYTGTARGRRSWTNIYTPANGALREVAVNLDALGGRTAWFALRFTTDSSVTREGHYLDDVRIVADRIEVCTPATSAPGPAVSYAIDLPATAQAGVSTPFVVTARDAWEQLVDAYAGTANVTAADPRAIVSTPISFSGGVAGGAAIFASAGPQGIAVSDALDPAVQGATATVVTPGPPAGLAIAAQPTRTVAGAAVAPPVQVRILDAFGNHAVAATDPVTVAIGHDAGGGTLGGTLTVSAAGGVATFPDLSIEKAGAGYTLRAASGELTAAFTDPFDVVPAAPVTLAVLTQPATVRAGVAIAPAVEIGLLDPYGNVADASDVVSLVLDANPGSSWLAGGSRIAAVNGVARFSDLWLNRVGSGYTLLATSGSLPPVSTAAFDVAPGAPYAVEVRTQPSSVLAGSPLSPPVTGAVLDAQGNLAADFSGPVHASLLAGPDATLLGSTSAAASAGVVTFASLAVDRVGSGYTLGLWAPGLRVGSSEPFDVAAGPPAALAFVGQPADAEAGATVSPAVRVVVTDAHGNLVSTATDAVTVALDENPGAGLLAGTLTTAATGGVATFADLALARAAAGYTLAATAAGLVPAVSAPFEVVAAPAATLEFSVPPQSVVAGEAITPPVQVRARDAHGNVATGFTGSVAVALSGSPGGASLGGDTEVAAVDGVATFSGLSLDRAGAGYALTATAGVLPAVTSGAFDVTAGAPAALAFVTQPATVQAGAALPPLTVEVRDRAGNRTASTAEVLVGLAAPGSATLSGTRRVAAVAGRAVFDDLSVDRAGSGYALSAISTGLQAGTTSTFDVTPGPAARLAIAGLPAHVDVDTITTVSVAAHDARGNVDASYAATVTLSSTDGAAVLPVVRLTAGVAPAVVVRFRSRGGHVLFASAAGDPSLSGEASTVVVGPDVPAPAAATESGCGCGSGNAGELGLLLALAGVWRAVLVPRRRRAA